MVSVELPVGNGMLELVMSMSRVGAGGSSGGTIIVLSVGAERSYAEVVGNNCKSLGGSFQLRRLGKRGQAQ